jgi:hypothetical protein
MRVHVEVSKTSFHEVSYEPSCNFHPFPSVAKDIRKGALGSRELWGLNRMSSENRSILVGGLFGFRLDNGPVILYGFYIWLADLPKRRAFVTSAASYL